MTQPTLLLDQVYAVEVPEGAHNYRILTFSNPNTLSYDYSIVKGDRVTKGLIAMIDLPAGTWEIICISKEVNTRLAKGIVGSSEWHFPERHIRYIDYAHPYDSENRQAWSIGFGDPVESLKSLLTSKGLDPVNKNYIILKKTA